MLIMSSKDKFIFYTEIPGEPASLYRGFSIHTKVIKLFFLIKSAYLM